MDREWLEESWVASPDVPHEEESPWDPPPKIRIAFEEEYDRMLCACRSWFNELKDFQTTRNASVGKYLTYGDLLSWVAARHRLTPDGSVTAYLRAGGGAVAPRPAVERR